MLCRALLATIAISYLVCVLFLTGIQKDDLDVGLLKKLQHHNIDFNDPSLRKQCENKTIQKSDRPSRDDLRQDATISQNVTSTKKVTSSTEHAIEKYSDELNITSLDLDSMVKYLSEATTVETDQITTDTNTKKDTISTMAETNNGLNKDNTQININAENPQFKIESLQNIIMFWEEYNRRNKTTTTPMSTTQRAVKTEATSTTANSVAERINHRNFETKQIDEVERISKLVAQYILSKNNSASVENSIDDKQIPLTTYAPYSTSMNPREIEEKFALSLNAINKLNENIAILQNKLQSSVPNHNYDIKSTETDKTTLKLAEDDVIFPRDKVVGIAQNLGNKEPYNQDHQNTLNLLQNKRYTSIRAPDHDYTSRIKFPLHFSTPLFIESDYRNQNNLNDYKQTPQLNPNTNKNTQEDSYREPNRNSFNLENYVYGISKENTVSSLNHNSQNESLKTSDVNVSLNYPYNNLDAAYAYDTRITHFNSRESSGNIENLLDTPIKNKYKSDADRTGTLSLQNSLKHSASQYNPNLQNDVNYEKVSSNLKSNSHYNLDSIKNGSPQVSTFKVLQYPNGNVFLNSQTPSGANENRYYKIDQQQTSDNIGQSFKNFEEKTSNMARDIEQQVVDNFQNKELIEHQFKSNTITNNTSLQMSPIEIVKYRYENTLSHRQIPIVQNNYSNFKTNQQHPQNENTVQKFKYAEEQTTNNQRDLKQPIAVDSFNNYNGQLYHPQNKYTAEKIYNDAVQDLSKGRLPQEQSLLNYKKENINNDKPRLPPDMLNQIAESVKQIILKDLKNEINTSLISTSTSSPSISPNSAKYETSSKPMSSIAISIDTTTSTTLMTTVLSTTKFLALNQTKPEQNKPVANSPKLSIIASTPRITKLTDSILEQKIDRVQEATQAIEKFLVLFNKYSTTAQEKTNSVNEKNKHTKLLASSLTPVPIHAPVANSPPRLPAVNLYDMGLGPKPVVIHHYVAPQIPPPPVPTNLIPDVPVIKPLQLAQQANFIHLPQPIMIQTNLHEIQPLRVPIINYDPINVVMPTQSPFKNQEERNRWDFMLKYGRNPDTRAEIQSAKQRLDAYSHVKSIQYSPPNYETVNSKKAKHTVNKTSDDTRLNPYYRYILDKLGVDKDKINQINLQRDKYSAKSNNEFDKSNYQPVNLHQNEENVFKNRGADTQYPLSNFNSQPNVAAQFASLGKDVSVINLNGYEKSNYRPIELQQHDENIYENRASTDTDAQFLQDNLNSTYYKKMAAQFASLDKDVNVINLNPSYINLIKGFGLNQNMKPEELDPNNSFYNQKQSVIQNKEENENSQNKKHKENYTQKGLRIYNENMYNNYAPPKVERNDYEDGRINNAINNRPKGSNHDAQVTNLMPTKFIATLRPSDGRIKTNNLPKTLVQTKNTWVPQIFNSQNMHKNEYDPQLRHNSDFLNRLYFKKDPKNKFVNLERMSDSPLQDKLLLNSPPSFKELLLQNRISHPTGRYYDQEESSQYSVNNKGQALISRDVGTSFTLNNHQRHGKTPWYESKKERNEKWQQHKARTSAILGGNRYNSKDSHEGSHFDSDGRGPNRERGTQVDSFDEKLKYSKKPYYDTSDSDKRFNNMDVRGFHEKLEGSDDWRNTHRNILSRQQLPLGGKPHKNEDMHFNNFLKTQQKVNHMLEKILASNPERLKSVEAL